MVPSGIRAMNYQSFMQDTISSSEGREITIRVTG
jgi:hypothetical protein